MQLSSVHNAKNLKFKLKYSSNKPEYFKPEQVINIEKGSQNNSFIVNIPNNEDVIVYANGTTADNLIGQLAENDYFKYIFEIQNVEESFIEVQSYAFRKPLDFNSSITIGVPDDILKQYSIQDLRNLFVWNGLGKPAVFSLSYKENAKKKADIRLLSDKKWMFIKNTLQGLKCTHISNIKNSDRPVDVFFATDIIFVPENNNIAVNDSFSEAIEKVNVEGKYFSRWEAYNKLVEDILNKKAEEFGSVRYSHFETTYRDGKILYRFYIKDTNNVLSLDDVDVKYTLNAGEDEAAKGVCVGEITNITNEYIDTSLEEQDKLIIIPQNGILRFDATGDRAIIKRRQKAKERMVRWECPIKSIVPLIEDGVSEPMVYKNVDIPESVSNYIGKIKGIKNFKFNKQQEDAIKTAIFTPDIAIIQGPPGTGKTTVIQAICEWFKDIFEKNERARQKADENYTISQPRILISSFQNVAVEKAISNYTSYGMPARRIARRGLLLDNYRKKLNTWKDNCNKAIEESISAKATLGFIEEKRNLSDRYFVYKQSGEKVEDAVKLIKYYQSFIGINYSDETLRLATSILNEYDNSINNIDNTEDYLLSNRINSLRTTMESFEDDGKRNARKFLTYISMSKRYDIDDGIICNINKIIEEDISKEDFDNYVASVEQLKQLYLSPKEQTAITSDLIDKCLLSLYDEYVNSYIDSLDNLEEKKSLIISEFMDDFNIEYESLVDKYSSLVGATCQTSLPTQSDEIPEYDLVIVDEAARANPLDLFIPMSLGKKIVLVGDQKQLPHMLEPDVLAILKNDERFKDMSYFEISLFEKLFDTFKRENISDSKSIQLKYQRRMHPQICDFVSEQFYDGELKSDPEALESLTYSIPQELCNGKALAYIDIPFNNNNGESTGQSKKRDVEAEMISKYVERIKQYDKDASIDIITFYSNQKTLLMDQIFKDKDEVYKNNIRIGTVDAFQGEEADYILLSCVRSNDISITDIKKKIEKRISYLKNTTTLSQNEEDNMRSEDYINEQYIKAKVGFLIKPNRLCVAFSRARKQLVAFGDSKTLDIIPSFNALHKKCQSGEGYYHE